MGVPGLWKELQRHGCDTALARLSELKSTLPSSSSSQTREHLRLGIDVSSWLFHAQKSIGGHNPQLRLLFYRLCRLLAVPDVLPVFVFDGPLRPKEKRGKVTQMYREVAFISDLKNLIVAFGFVVYDALGEAEAEMARMVRENLLDAVMSDDVDCFVFGATLVIRNWGQELSGSKARTDYVAEQSASEAPSASSADEQAECAIGEQRPLSAKDRLALGTNLITYFKATSLKADEISQAGLILVAVLSGGDYDVQGLPRCGAKISMALARAGYGDSLIDGLRKHCRPPVQSSRSSHLAAPEATESWPGFLAEWRDAVRHELSTNQSGYIGKRFKKLAASVAFAELLSTKASLSVLGSYVWPVTNASSPIFNTGIVDIGKIGELCQDLFHWTAPHTLETFRNNLWQGCAVRELCDGDGTIVSLKRAAVQAKKANNDGGKISTFFAVRARDEIEMASSSGCTGRTPLVLSVARERESGSTGYVREARLVCDVKAYVDLAKGGLDFGLSFHDFEDGEGPPSSQSTTVSPRKRKPLTDPEKELRLWIAHDVVKRIASAAKELETYHRKKNVKGKENTNKSTTANQGRLDTFFMGNKASAMPPSLKATLKVSPSKRRAPLLSSQSSLSSAPSRSRSPSPTFQSPTKSISRTRRVSSSKQQYKRIANIPGWTSDLLDDSSDEEPTHDDDYDFDDDSTLPTIMLPSNQHNTLESFPADESVEFIRANMIPLNRNRNTNTPGMAIEVSDDSDEG